MLAGTWCWFPIRAAGKIPGPAPTTISTIATIQGGSPVLAFGELNDCSQVPRGVNLEPILQFTPSGLRIDQDGNSVDSGARHEPFFWSALP